MKLEIGAYTCIGGLQNKIQNKIQNVKAWRTGLELTPTAVEALLQKHHLRARKRERN